MTPDTVPLSNRQDDPYAWLLIQAQALGARRSVDHDGLREYLEEAAEEILSKATSRMVNLMAHAVKVSITRNPEVVGHWRSEIAQFQVQIAEEYRPSMRQKIDLDKLYRRARKLVVASFRDHGEPDPVLPDECPFTIDMLTNEDLSVDDLTFLYINGVSMRAIGLDPEAPK